MNKKHDKGYVCAKCKRSGSQSSDDSVKELGISTKKRYDDNAVKNAGFLQAGPKSEAYPEIKIPQEFIIKFETDKNMAPGST